jgi:predicted CoA-binding protein
MPDDKVIRDLLKSAKTIAVVGLSSNPMRASHSVSEYMQRAGYRIIPVNPNETEVLGERAFASLADVTEKIDIVDVFRRPEYVPEIASAAIEKGARCLWTQMGISHPEAARNASEHGLTVVMDRCIMREHMRLIS